MKQKASSLIRNLQIVFLISTVLLVLSLIASLVSMNRLKDSSWWVNHTNEVLITTETLNSLVKDAESAQRAYLITNNNDFITILHDRGSKVAEVESRLKKLTSDNELQVNNTSEISYLIKQRFDQMERTISLSQLSSSKNTAELFYHEFEKGKHLMEKLAIVTERLKNEENRLLESRIASQKSFTERTPFFIVLAALISIVIIVFSYFRIRKDVEERVRKQIEDEAKYIETASRISVMEEVTGKIANGEYSVRSNDKQDDDLGRISHALNKMVESLEASFKSIEKQSWLREGTLVIADTFQGEKDLQVVSNNLLSELCRYIGAPIATLYVNDNGYFGLTASFSASQAPVRINTGQGLAGQAITDKRINVVKQLPSNYLSVASSTGATDPVAVIIMPLVYDDETIAVMEIGFLREPSELQVGLLEVNADAISIGIKGVLNHQRLQNLLEETQSQSEELQSQHNELESINVELETQAERLQASEEELRTQQAELRKINSDLEERTRTIEERNEIIQQKAKELEQSSRYKSEFLANISHELRTPLNSILLLSRLLAENSDKHLNEEEIQYAKVIQNSGHGLLQLIDEILDLSKIEAGKVQLEIADVPAWEIMEDMDLLFKNIAAEKGLTLEIKRENNVPGLIRTDKMRLEQVLKNLLSNALKFTSKGSVSLLLHLHPDRKNLIRFTVKDTGIGIPREKQKVIFEAFQQADGSTKRQYGGTGLGLSISLELARLLGGDIILESIPGEGSAFTLEVPLSVETGVYQVSREKEIFETAEPKLINEVPVSLYISPTIPADVDDDRDNAKPGDKFILIVEDDIAFAKTLLGYARKKGYKGLVCVRGDAAMNLVLQYRPVGILLDVQLPVKSGLEVLDELKSNAQTRHIPVHILSAFSLKNESLLKGAVDFVNKPVDPEQMQAVFEKIEYVLNRKLPKVLIIDDNPKHAKALSYFLETSRIHSELKSEIEEAIDSLKTKDVDCVILDMGIPDQKAYEILEEARKNDGFENIPIIIFTGKSLSLAEEQRIRQYADSIIVKTAHSYQRMLDEVSLFLHLVEENKASTTQNIRTGNLGALGQILENKTVLVVDDDVRNIFSLTKALEKFRMNVLSAVDGMEALTVLEQNPDVDLVLLDIMMPKLDGYETAKKIRENPQWKQLPVIAVTAKAMMGDREKCIQAGASDYITKPIDVDQLISLLRVWLYDKA